MYKRNVSVLFMLIVLLLLLLTGCQEKAELPQRPNDAATVATVNGEPIAYGEFQLLMIPQRAAIFQYFEDKYKAGSGQGFWTTAHNGELPLDMIRERTLKSAVRDKVIQLVAHEQGLMKDLSYTTFISEYAAENERRQRAVEKKEPIYGPVRYSVQDYYQYRMGNLAIQLRDALAAARTRTDSELLKEYESRILDFKVEGAVTFQKVSILLTGSAADKQQAEQKLNAMKALVASGTSFEAAAKTLSLSVSSQEMNDRTGKSDSVSTPALRQAAFQLAVGQTSPVVEDQGSLYLIQLTTKGEPTYRTFDDMKGLLIQNLNQAQYDAKVEQWIRTAKVELIHEHYDQTSPE
ncbi:peptidylprolyl isomerase [Paenibacillus koleovorans]|uniref:peptidylprolyl isomerase n=1 Tax=Paenibacillus koleovorans TaxID=121608 RepID=UPI000FDB2A88|nr:peptidylprolyl isomerase [Paenibacillus koleovorans]